MGIGEDAFRGCTGLESITVPKSVTRIVYHAFVECESFVLKVVAGSYAEKYAKKEKIPYELV